MMIRIKDDDSDDESDWNVMVMESEFRKCTLEDTEMSFVATQGVEIVRKLL